MSPHIDCHSNSIVDKFRNAILTSYHTFLYH